MDPKEQKPQSCEEEEGNTMITDDTIDLSTLELAPYDEDN